MKIQHSVIYLVIVVLLLLIFIEVIIFVIPSNRVITILGSNIPKLVEFIPPEKESANLLFVGDVMLGRYVETLMNKNGEQYAFENILPTFNSHDLVIANLEGPIPVTHTQTLSNTFHFSFKESVAQLLKKNHVDLVTLANNHTSDQGEDDYENTKKVLTEFGIESFGHALKIGDVSVIKKEVNGYEFVFIGFNTTFGNFDKEKALEIVAKEVLQTRGTVILFMHWGTEYSLTSSKIQQDLAHNFIDVGADVIIGSHPHVVQEIEEYKGKMIFYSLGNLIFDQYFSDDVQQGLMVSIIFEGDNINYSIIPVQSTQSQPKEMDNLNKKAFLKELATRSQESLRENIMSGLL